MHQAMGFHHARLDRFVVGQYHLQLDETSQAFNLVDVNTRSTDHVNQTLFAYPTYLPMSQGQDLAQAIRIRRWRARIEGRLRASDVGPLVVNQLALLWSEHAKLEPT